MKPHKKTTRVVLYVIGAIWCAAIFGMVSHSDFCDRYPYSEECK